MEHGKFFYSREHGNRFIQLRLDSFNGDSLSGDGAAVFSFGFRLRAAGGVRYAGRGARAVFCHAALALKTF